MSDTDADQPNVFRAEQTSDADDTRGERFLNQPERADEPSAEDDASGHHMPGPHAQDDGGEEGESPLSHSSW